MDDKYLKEKIPQAIEAHCSHLHADPYLVQKVLRAAERKETPIVRSKMRFTLILTFILMLLTATAVAAVLLTGQEVIEQEAVPLAQNNDGEVRPVSSYTYEELKALIAVVEENGIFLDDDSSVMRALRMGEGYYEEETIMEICRTAFGGLIYEWTVEEQHFFHEMMVKIGYSTENYMDLPTEGEMTSGEIRALAAETIRKHCGEDLPLLDRSQYRITESFYRTEGGNGVWNIDFMPCTLEGAFYGATVDSTGEWVEYGVDPAWDWSEYTETVLEQRVNTIYNYRQSGSGKINWEYDAWYAFGQKLPGATHSDKWNEEYDGYAATTYLLPTPNDLTKKQARDIAFADAGVKDYTSVTELLLGKDNQRIWKISFATSEKTGRRQVLSYEIDSMTGNILRIDAITAEKEWARYMLQETYEAHRPEETDVLTEDEAIEMAVAALYRALGREDIPYTDPACYAIEARFSTYSGGYTLIFNPLVMDYGRASVDVRGIGKSVDINFVNAPELTGDNLFERFEDVYGPNIYWEQDMWVKFGEEMKNYEASTFEGKLFKLTTYLPESAVKISRDKAMDIAYLDSDHADINRIMLIDAEPNPIWKVRVSTDPTTTLYEIDAMTGEILDKELYYIQMDNFDHEMKMYTLRRDFMPAHLAEFGVKRVAMELCVKAYHEDFDYLGDSPDILISGAYRITEEGLTVTFTPIDPRQATYVVKVAEGAMSADVERVPGVENTEDLSAEQHAVLYELFEGSDRFQVLEELPEPWQSNESDYGPVEGETTLAEAQAHAFSMLVNEVGQDTVDSFGKFAVGYLFSRFQNDGDCTRWTFFFLSPEDSNVGFRVTFALRNNELWGTGEVHDINDNSNG